VLVLLVEALPLLATENVPMHMENGRLKQQLKKYLLAFGRPVETECRFIILFSSVRNADVYPFTLKYQRAFSQMCVFGQPIFKDVSIH